MAEENIFFFVPNLIGRLSVVSTTRDVSSPHLNFLKREINTGTRDLSRSARLLLVFCWRRKNQTLCIYTSIYLDFYISVYLYVYPSIHPSSVMGVVQSTVKVLHVPQVLNEVLVVLVPGGYGRIALALLAFALMPCCPWTGVFCYLLSALLDAFDGHAARALNQCTSPRHFL